MCTYTYVKLLTKYAGVHSSHSLDFWGRLRHDKYIIVVIIHACVNNEVTR